MLQGQTGGVGFRHELARLTVEQALGPGRRADLHGRALAALLTRPGAAPDPARLAHHADEAGRLPVRGRRRLADSDQEPQLRTALTELERLGARPLAATVARQAAGAGGLGRGPGPRPATRANPANLTARELEVLRLLVEGRSNRQIAEQLFISHKTASVHVTNLPAKLGAHSRLEAAASGWSSPPSSKVKVPGSLT
jgi:DNA-binding CsgD family transcriptional regulator